MLVPCVCMTCRLTAVVDELGVGVLRWLHGKEKDDALELAASKNRVQVLLICDHRVQISLSTP